MCISEWLKFTAMVFLCFALCLCQLIDAMLYCIDQVISILRDLCYLGVYSVKSSLRSFLHLSMHIHSIFKPFNFFLHSSLSHSAASNLFSHSFIRRSKSEPTSDRGKSSALSSASFFLACSRSFFTLV